MNSQACFGGCMNCNTSDYLVAFDFDGVIWDTVDECYFIGYPIFKLIEGEILADTSLIKDQFRKGRFLAKDADDFYIILRLLKENIEIDFEQINYKQMEKFRDDLNDKAKEFSKAFYFERGRHQDEDFDAWLSLQGPYPGIPEQLPLIKESFKDLIICSTKDSRSIEKMLQKYNQSYKIYGRESSTDKKEQFKKVVEDYNISIDKIIFIDDILENLIKVKTLGINCFLANWGYNGSIDYDKLQQADIPVIKMDNILQQFQAWLIDSKTHTQGAIAAGVPQNGHFSTSPSSASQ
jgi:FMN phosphatase YigB (HAD superfamily)